MRQTRQVVAATMAIMLVVAVVPLARSEPQTCGLRPPTEETHPADLNADGEVTNDEFVEYAESQENAESGKQEMDADGDGKVTTEEFLAFAEGQELGPVELTPDNFDAKTKQFKAAFVKFMAPWCGHCQNMAKSFHDLAKKIHSESPGTVLIGTVNCDQQREFCEMFQVEGLPTLLLMKDPEVFEDATPVLFQGERNFEGMLSFLEQEGVLSN
eukprot:766006-Hanusia_phi.AAC.2